MQCKYIVNSAFIAGGHCTLQLVRIIQYKLFTDPAAMEGTCMYTDYKSVLINFITQT